MINKFVNYIKDSVKELKKVIWPTKKEVIKKTEQVLFVSFMVFIFLGIVDFLLVKGLELIVK
ncbi:MAG: preprotein translocase subunit SecE [Patescibacteria group bacterium]|nr:preprotein translocase subunit SecE [Patescibacteria group bacterium]MDD4304476.1 preprotein translocase subunit SecE [Patescibacteria group bacterium]MDD4694836.1 preprotein translocase subunit SecE [Patescibacteria group bacterium]